eukprot:10390398-Karenia_brevis.AAC.1
MVNASDQTNNVDSTRKVHYKIEKTILGKWDAAKLPRLQELWVAHLQRTEHNLQELAQATGFEFTTKEDVIIEDKLQVVHIPKVSSTGEVDDIEDIVLDDGFEVGDRVRLLKRITVDFPVELPAGAINKPKKTPTHRKDMPAGYETFIVDVKTTPKGNFPVLEFMDASSGITHGSTTRHHVGLDKIVKVEAATKTPTGAKPEQGSGEQTGGETTKGAKGAKKISKIPKGLEFVENSENHDITWHKEWTKCLADYDEETQVSNAKDRVSFAKWLTSACMTKYTEEDFIVIEKTVPGAEHGLYAVYSNKDFEPKTINFLADSNAILDRLYTHGRSNVVRTHCMIIFVST